MHDRLTWLLGVLVAAQAAHSIEEYLGRLWDVLPPARFVSGLVSSNLEQGFIIINVAIAALGIACLLGPIRSNWSSGRIVAWCWASIETVNAAAHLAIAAWQGGYAPGVATAPLLIASSVWLMRELVAAGRRPPR